MGYFIGSDHTHIDYHKNFDPIESKLINSFDNAKYLNTALEFYVVEHEFDGSNNYLGTWFTISDSSINTLKEYSAYISNVTINNSLSTTTPWRVRQHGTTTESTATDNPPIWSNTSQIQNDVFWDISYGANSTVLYVTPIDGSIYTRARQVYMDLKNKDIYDKICYGDNRDQFARGWGSVIIGKTSDFPNGMQYADRVITDFTCIWIPNATD